jgi:hypothetical protein
MFGIRDAVLGGLLYTASTPLAVRRALIAGMVVDGIDILIAAYGVWNGDLDALAADLVGGGAVVFLGMAAFALRKPGMLANVAKGVGKG